MRFPCCAVHQKRGDGPGRPTSVFFSPDIIIPTVEGYYRVFTVFLNLQPGQGPSAFLKSPEIFRSDITFLIVGQQKMRRLSFLVGRDTGGSHYTHWVPYLMSTFPSLPVLPRKDFFFHLCEALMPGLRPSWSVSGPTEWSRLAEHCRA